MKPDEARAKVLERKTQQEHAPLGKQQKRGPQEITPPTLPDHKRRKVTPATTTTGPHTSYAEAASSIKVAILPSDPEKILSQEELTAVEDAIVREMLSGAEHKIRFTGVHFRPGMLIVDCVDEHTAQWVKERAPQLKKWEGTALKACVGDDIPKVHLITVFFPRSKELSTEEVLALVLSQNEGVQTRLWKVLSSKEEGSGRLLTLGIDEGSLENIKKGGSTLFYRFGKIPVSVVRVEKTKIVEQEKAEEAGPSSAAQAQITGHDDGHDDLAESPASGVTAEGVDMSRLTLGVPGEEEEEMLLGEGEQSPQTQELPQE